MNSRCYNTFCACSLPPKCPYSFSLLLGENQKWHTHGTLCTIKHIPQAGLRSKQDLSPSSWDMWKQRSVNLSTSLSSVTDMIYLIPSGFWDSVVCPPLPVQTLFHSYYPYRTALCKWCFWQSVWLRELSGISGKIYVLSKKRVSRKGRKIWDRIIAENTRFRDY